MIESENKDKMTESINKDNNDNNKLSQSENKNKQSPIDYILEKKDCEMPDIPDSNGGE
jgi:hypothetical protein